MTHKRLSFLDDAQHKVQPERWQMLQKSWEHWQNVSVYDMAKHIVLEGEHTPGVDDVILFARIKELEERS
jgi:hypothetical protein